VLVVVVFVVVVFVVVPVLVVVFLRCRSGRDRGLEGRDQRRAKPTAAIRLMKAWRALSTGGIACRLVTHLLLLSAIWTVVDE